MPYLKLEVGELQTNVYLFFSASSRNCFIVDPGAEAERIIAAIEKEKLLPQAVILTHGHADHVGAVTALLSHFHLPLWLHEAAEKEMRSQVNREIAAMFGLELPPAASRLLIDGETIGTADLKLEVIHSPGHSPGSILLYGEGLLFTGDTLFKDDVGRTDLPGGDELQLRGSLDKIRKFAAATVILPGHGAASILEQELKSNPYL
ncbi:MAG: MBL fold metallo-hydrolase [Chrysiogenales bacterium]|nr:MAG: MBL fold metallo-hydrolase [Chrysiogenales bacterium]